VSTQAGQGGSSRRLNARLYIAVDFQLTRMAVRLGTHLPAGSLDEVHELAERLQMDRHIAMQSP